MKNWCFWTVVLEKTLERPLDYKEIQPVHPKGNQSWVSIGTTDAEAETPILWPPDGKNCLIGKDPDAGKDWRQEEKVTTEGEMVGWHLQLDGHEFEQAPGVGDGQGSLACCSPQSLKALDMTKDWIELNWSQGFLGPPQDVMNSWGRLCWSVLSVLRVKAGDLPCRSLWGGRVSISSSPYSVGRQIYGGVSS